MNTGNKPLLIIGTIIAIMFILGLFTQSSESAEIEWNDKPVLCGPHSKIFGYLGDKGEDLVFQGKMHAQVNDPDNPNGLADNPARLPFALYINFKTKTFSVLEYHNAPYNVYCILAIGDSLELLNLGDLL